MILAGETLSAALELPFFLPSNSNPIFGPVTGHVFTLGEVQIRAPGAGFVNVALDHIVEKGFGAYAAIATSSQAATAGIAYVDAIVSGAQPYTGDEEIRLRIAGIFVGETTDADRSIPFHLASSSNPLVPITGHSWATGEVKVFIPGSGAFVNADITRITEIGAGDYSLALTGAQVTGRGKVYLYALVTGSQPDLVVADIVTPPTGDLVEPTITNIIPTPSVAAGAVGGFSANPQIARWTPVQADITDNIALGIIELLIKFAAVDDDTTDWIEVYGSGVFQGQFATHSTQLAITNGVRVFMLPAEGWPISNDAPTSFLLKTRIVDTAGNIEGV